MSMLPVLVSLQRTVTWYVLRTLNTPDEYHRVSYFLFSCVVVVAVLLLLPAFCLKHIEVSVTRLMVR
jgi:hypothetical protein